MHAIDGVTTRAGNSFLAKEKLSWLEIRFPNFVTIAYVYVWREALEDEDNDLTDLHVRIGNDDVQGDESQSLDEHNEVTPCCNHSQSGPVVNKKKHIAVLCCDPEQALESRPC